MGPVVAGLLFALLVISGTRILSPRPGHVLCAVLLGGAAGVYVGASLTQRGLPLVAIQSAGFVGYALAAVGGSTRTRVLGWAWLLHAGWDLVHYRGFLATSIPTWYQVACMVADLLIGAYLVDWARNHPVTDPRDQG